MGDSFLKLVSSLADWAGARSDWGKIAGTIIITVLLVSWTWLVFKNKQWIDPGSTWGLLIFAIFVLLARKPTQSPPPSS
jgi:hypothetical protein